VWKTVLAVTLLIISLVTMAIVGQIIGLWDWAGPLWQWLGVWPVTAPHVERYELGHEHAVALQAREAELAQWQARLEEEAAALEAERRALEEARFELERREEDLARREAQLEARAAAVQEMADAAAARQQLRALYEAMRPQEAARILVDLDDEEISLLLLDMSPRQAGQILAALPPERAAAVSRRLGL